MEWKEWSIVSKIYAINGPLKSNYTYVELEWTINTSCKYKKKVEWEVFYNHNIYPI